MKQLKKENVNKYIPPGKLAAPTRQVQRGRPASHSANFTGFSCGTSEGKMRESKDEPQTAVQQSMRVYGSKPAVVGCRKYFSTGETIETTVFERKPPIIKGPILGIGVQEWAANCTPAMRTEFYIQTVDGGKNTSKHYETV